MPSQRRVALLAAVLLLPIILAYAATGIGVWMRGEVWTGFYVMDSAYYMANARSHFSDGGFTLLYSNPYSSHPAAPDIYFQPQLLVLGVLVHFLPGIPPGFLQLAYGLVFGWLCLRMTVLLFAEVYGIRTRTDYLILTMLVWGGGAFVLAGLAYNGTAPVTIDALFHFDPVNGFWFLNFGRNLFFPHEAYYHFLVIWILRLLLKQQRNRVLVVSALLAISTPITGIEILGFLAAYFILERLYFRNPLIPWKFGAALLTLLILDVYYYLVWLPGFREHAILQEQWTLAWTLDGLPMLFAYCLVGGITLVVHRRFHRMRIVLGRPYQRVFLCLFITAFLLANHEAFFEPHQPIHFTRGYIWTPLFLMGVPGLKLLMRLLRRTKAPVILRKFGVPALAFLFLLDNTVWLALRPINTEDTLYSGISHGDLEALNWLNKHADRSWILVDGDYYLPTLAPAYADITPWYGHPHNTPESKMRLEQAVDLLLHGTILPYWTTRPTLLALRPNQETDFLEVYRNTHGGKEPKLLFRSETMAFYGL